MAIQFTKAISQNKLLFAYNNNIIRFNSNSALIPATAEIIGLGVSVVLYPNPSGDFYFNFKDYISAIINSDNFKDDMVVPVGYWSYNWTPKIYLNNAITVKIIFEDTSFETIILNTKWLSAYCQLDSIEVLPNNNPFILTPNNWDIKPVLKYWEGYPFDFTFYNPNPTNLSIVNENDYETGVGLQNYLFSRVVITNGFDLIPFVINNGVSDLALNLNGGINFPLSIEKIIPNCNDKHYIKWINRYGGWNYWLFDRGKKTITPKGLGEINNDFNNVEDTISQTVNIGVTSKKSISLNDDVSEIDMMMLVDLFESPKVYLFTGEPNTISSFNNWQEVNVKDKAVKIQDVKYNFINIQLEIDLPIRTTRTI